MKARKADRPRTLPIDELMRALNAVVAERLGKRSVKRASRMEETGMHGDGAGMRAHGGELQASMPALRLALFVGLRWAASALSFLLLKVAWPLLMTGVAALVPAASVLLGALWAALRWAASSVRMAAWAALKQAADVLKAELKAAWPELMTRTAGMASQVPPPSSATADAKAGKAGKRSGAAAAPGAAPPQQRQRRRTAECAICFGVHALADMVSAGSDTPGSSSAASGCGHRFCVDCMGQYVCTCVDSSKYPVQCPSPGCKATLAHHDVIWLLHDMPAHMERYTRLEVESSIHPSQRLYCPHKDCSTLLLRPEEGEPEGPMVCPACERTLCASCLIPGWHEGFSCEAFQALPPHQRSADDAALLRLSDVLRWKQCPSCSHVVERSEGCNHMACLCGGSFCYSCGLAYCDNASTAANQHGTPACACALFDVPPADQDEDDGGEDEGEDESESDEEQDAAAAPIVVAPVYGYLDRDARLCRNGRRVAKARCRHARSIHDCPHGPGTCWFRHDEDDRRLLGFWW